MSKVYGWFTIVGKPAEVVAELKRLALQEERAHRTQTENHEIQKGA